MNGRPEAKILIATPSHGRQVTIDYMLSVRSLETAFRREGIASDVNLTIGSVLPRSRAALASRVVSGNDYTHLLFIDSDMGFKPEAVFKLLRSGEPFCGCLYPSRRLDYEKLHKAARQIADPIVARNVGQTYICYDNLQVADDNPTRVISRNGLIKVGRIGFGLALIHRSVLERMREAFPSLVLKGGNDPEYRAMGASYDILQVFESVQGPTGLFLGEDLSFCHRWTEGCGGEIWACVDEEIGHVGPVSFVGRPSDLLRRGGYL